MIVNTDEPSNTGTPKTAPRPSQIRVRTRKNNSKGKSTIVKNIACPQCREKGGDSTGNHMMVFEEGTGYCTKCPKAFTPTEVEAAEAGKRSPRASSNKYNASAGNGWQRPKDKTIEDIQFYGTIGDAKRGISVNADTHFGIRTETSTSTGAAIRRFYPYWDSEDIVGYKSRKLPKDFEKAVGTIKGAELFGWKQCTGPKRILLITEGEEDCAAGWMMNRTMNRQADDTKYHKVNPHIVSLPSGAKGIEKVFMHHFEDLMKYDKIYWFGDNPLVDEDGSDALEVAVRVLGHERLHVAPYPDRKKDLCDIMKIDKCGPLATAAFAHMFFNMKPYQPADVVEGSEYTWDAVFKEPIVGYDIPFSSINETLKGFRLGEHTIILAPSGAGKSTFCRKIGHYMGRVHNWKIGSIYLEEQDTETVQGYAACELNIALDVIRGNPEMVSQEDRDRCMQMIAEDHIFLNHNGSIQPDVLMDKIRYMVAKGVKLIIFDHLTMAVNLEDDQRLALDTLMENIYKFVKLNDVHILSVIHLNRNSKVDFSRGGEINEGSIRGSAGVIQQSWNCIAIECDVQHPTYSNFRFIRILKCREVGSRAVGLIPGSYSYDYDTGAYTFDPNVSKEDLGSPEGGGTANVSMGAKSYDNKAC